MSTRRDNRIGSSRGNSSAISVRVAQRPCECPARGGRTPMATQGPPPGGHGVGHQVVDQLDPDAPGGFEAEGRRAARQRQVVVAGLRDVRHAQAPSDAWTAGRPRTRCRPRRSSRARRSPASVATSGRRAASSRVGGIEVECCRVGPRGPNDRPALDMDSRHVVVDRGRTSSVRPSSPHRPSLVVSGCSLTSPLSWRSPARVEICLRTAAKC